MQQKISKSSSKYGAEGGVWTILTEGVNNFESVQFRGCTILPISNLFQSFSFRQFFTYKFQGLKGVSHEF